MNDDAGDKQSLITAKGQESNSSVINIPSVSSNNKSNQFNDSLLSPNRGQDSLPVSTSAYDLSKSGHPIACIFTFIFKLLAFLVYLFFSIKFDNSIFIFVVTITFGALDFWTVKNVTGRLLVGMRWWNSQNELGVEEYKYETYGSEYTPNQVDYAFFWSSQLVFFVIWVLIALTNILTPFWLILDLITIGMLFSNLYGFYKCKSEHQQKINSVKDNLKLKGFSFLTNYLMKK